MSKKFKAVIHAPKIMNWNRKARKHGKKYSKFPETEKYSKEWRAEFVRKRFKKLLKYIDVELEVIGFDKLPKAPAIIAPNHSSSMDPGLILLALENPDPSPDAQDGYPTFLAKSELKDDKKARGYAQLLDTFFIDRTNPRGALVEMDKMSEFAKENKLYEVIFPEGTRSKDGVIGEFKGGAFRSAKKGFRPIVPVTINNALSITDMNRTGKLKVQVIFHDQIKPMSFMTQDTKTLAANVQKIVQKAWVQPEGKRSEIENNS